MTQRDLGCDVVTFFSIRLRKDMMKLADQVRLLFFFIRGPRPVFVCSWRMSVGCHFAIKLVASYSTPSWKLTYPT